MKEWRCKTCGAIFTPNPPDYSCPECGAGNTVPRDYVQLEIPPPIIKPPKEPERSCTECGSPMRCGYLVVTESPIDLTTIGEGVYWSSGEGGLLGERVSLKAYACPECGKIEVFARRIQKERAIIEGAKYICE